MMHIDSKTYWIGNYDNTITEKKQIILSSSLRKDSNHIIHLKHKDFGKTKKWNTYTISRDGTIYQHYDPIYYSEFLEKNDGNKQVISIVLENMGYLIRDNDIFLNWINEICDGDIFERKWMGFNYWEKFSEKQILSTVHLCSMLCEKFNIPKTLIEFYNFHKDIALYKGILFRSNYYEESADMNPNFDITNFNKLLTNVI